MALERVAKMLKICAGCGMCTGKGPHIPFREGGIDPDEQGSPSVKCLAYEIHKRVSYAPKGYLFLGDSIANRGMQITEDTVEPVFKCVSCGICNNICYINTPEVVREIREEVNKAGFMPDGVRQFNENIKRFLNPFRAPREERANWAEGLDLPSKGKIAYFVGCHTAYKYPEIARAVVGILRGLETGIAILGNKEVCCGSPAIWAGEKDVIKARSKWLTKELSGMGAEKVVFSCPHCYRAFSLDYTEQYGPLPFETAHVSELYTKLLPDAGIKLNNPLAALKKAAYHDPCFLGKHMLVEKEPRQIINLIPGLELVELQGEPRWSACCGSGGTVVANAYPAYAQDAAKGRMQQASEKADVLLTNCPQCLDHFRSTEEGSTSQVEDLNLVLWNAMGRP